VLLVVGGVLMVFANNVIGGIWFVFIGFFLRQAASSGLQQVEMREALGGETVSRFMTARPVTVGPELSLREFVDRFVLPHHFAIFPVVDADGRLLGTVGSRAPAGLSSEEWDRRTVAEVMRPASPQECIGADTDAVEALSRLRGEDGRRLIVLDGERPVGIVSLRDLLDFLALKIDLHPRGRR
jgi:CBS domain-containing protein